MWTLPGCGHVSTYVLLYRLDSNEMIGKNVSEELHEDATCCFENTLTNNIFVVVFFPSQKSSNKGKQYMLTTAEKVWTVL